MPVKYQGTEEQRRYGREYSRKWRQEHPDRYREVRKAYRKKVNGKYDKEYAAKHPNHRQSYRDVREAVIYFLIERDGMDCFYCKNPLDLVRVHIAHKLSVLVGGKNCLDNLVLSCPFCNISEGVAVRRKIHGT